LVDHQYHFYLWVDFLSRIDFYQPMIPIQSRFSFHQAHHFFVSYWHPVAGQVVHLIFSDHLETVILYLVALSFLDLGLLYSGLFGPADPVVPSVARPLLDFIQSILGLGK
jgi:hypothetical protein